MVSWTKLLTGQIQEHEELRYNSFLKQAPKIVVWNITKVCNLSCRHCYFEASQTTESNQLNSKEAADFIEDLAKFGVSVLLFSGGEPLLREDVFDLAKLATDKGIRAVLSTNGTLITEKIAKKIKQSGFLYVGISLDGQEKINDKFRQSKGAFRMALEGLEYCQGLRLKVGLRFTLTKYNFKDLPFIFELTQRKSISRLCLYHLVYTGRGSSLINDDLSHQEKREVLGFIWQKTLDFFQKGLKTEIFTVDNHSDGVWIYLRLKSYNLNRAQIALSLLKAQGGNSSGVNIACVDNCGNIYPDQFLRKYPLGDIRKKRFSDVWQDKDNDFLQALRNRKLFLKGRCQRCNFLSICNGNFRARAEAAFSDIWQEDPACFLTDEEIYGNNQICSTISCNRTDA